MQRKYLAVGVLIASTAMNGCGGGGSDGGNRLVSAAPKYTIGGTVSGLSGSGLSLRNNGANDLTVSANGAFTFSAQLTSGTAYSVTIASSPSAPTQNCTITNGTGLVTSANITNVTIACTNAYTIGGTIAGLAGTGLVLRNNGGDDLQIASNGAFTFSSPISSGSAYAVTVQSSPLAPTQTCVVANANGSVDAANIASVNVVCTTSTYLIGGIVSGLVGHGLVLRDNGGDDLTVNSNGAFSFSTRVASAVSYTVAVKTSPSGPAQTCAITNGAGTVVAANVSNVGVQCTTDSYTIGGTVSGLQGSGLILQDINGANLPINANGSFAFPGKTPSGGLYNVTIAAQPTTPTQTCVFYDVSTGSVTNQNVSLQITCTKKPGRFAYIAGNGVNCYAVDAISGALVPLTLGTCINANLVALASHPSGKFLFAVDEVNQVVSTYAVNQNTGSTSLVASSQRSIPGDPVAATTDPTGTYLYVADHNGRIYGFAVDSASGLLTAIGGSPFSSILESGCSDIHVEPSGRFVYCADQAGVSAYSIGAAGVLTSISGSLAPVNGLATQLIIDGSGGFLYSGNDIGNTFTAFSINQTTGALTRLANSPTSIGGEPTWLAISHSGNFVYVQYNLEAAIGVFSRDAATGELTFVQALGIPSPSGTFIATHPSLQTLYTIKYDTGQVNGFAIDGTTGSLSLLTGSPFGSGNGSTTHSIVFSN